jgi:hypothetical protein
VILLKNIEGQGCAGRGRAAFITFIVLVLVVLLTVLVMANAQSLAHLKAELKQIEARHLTHWRSVNPQAAETLQAAPPIQP